jgi:hypothetical protein
MTELNLRAMIREVLDETDLVDPTDVAEETFHRLTRGQYAPALRQTLRQFARLVMTSQGAAPTGDSAPANRSWKRDAIRAELGGFREYYHTADGWKHLRDCTRDDLLFAANERREQADRNIAEAERLEKLASRLDDGQTVGDLDDLGEDAA